MGLFSQNKKKKKKWGETEEKKEKGAHKKWQKTRTTKIHKNNKKIGANFKDEQISD